MITLIALFFSQALAVENLPCNRVLESTYAANEIVIKGKLDTFWETGMEDRTGWSIVDEETRRWLSREPWDSQFFLKEGDYVIVAIAGVTYRGFYKEAVEKQNFMLDGRVETAYPNVPHLIDSQGKDVLNPADFQRAFFRGFEAEVVRKMEDEDLAALDQRHRLWRALHERLRDKRQIDVGNGQIHEAAYFSSVGRGELFKSRGYIKIRVPKGESDFYPNDTLYVDDGTRTHKFEIQSFPWKGNDEVRRLMSRPHKAIVIR